MQCYRAASHSLGRIGLLLIVLSLAASLTTLALRGAVSPRTIRIVDGTKYVTSIYGENDSQAIIGYAENFSKWIVGFKDTTLDGELVQSDGGLVLRGAFQNASHPASIGVFKKAIINISEFPILVVRLKASTGIEYGLRFFGESSNGTRYNVWWEGSPLDHRIGRGAEEIRLNMQRQAYLATGHTVQQLTTLEIYVEAQPNTRTVYQLSVSLIDFEQDQLSPIELGKDYRAVYLDLNYSLVTPTWYLDKIHLGTNLEAQPNSILTVYLAIGGTLYTSKSASSVPYSPAAPYYKFTIYPDTIEKTFPEPLPRSDDSIILVADAGSIQYAQFDSFDMTFLPNTPSSEPTSGQVFASYYTYVLSFLFFFPVTLSILVFRRFFGGGGRGRNPILLVLISGFVSRIALAPVTAQPFDMKVILSSARGWFQYGSTSGSIGPTLPFAYFLYWVPYSPYAVLQALGFQDIQLLGHSAGLVEAVFVKLFPILADVFLFFVLFKWRPDGRGFVYATFYFLNPLAIFISAVWGQYDTATIALVVLGIYWLAREKAPRAGIAFATSGMIQILGFIPYALLLIKTIVERNRRLLLLLATPAAFVLVYPPERELMLRFLFTVFGLASALSFSNPGIYTVFGSFPQLSFVSGFHPLLVSCGAILVGVFRDASRRTLGITSIIFYTGLISAALLTFSDILAGWVWLLPIGLLYAALKDKQALGAFTLVLGTAVAFLMMSHTLGSSYLILGDASYPYSPVHETARNGLQIFSVTTTILAATYLAFFCWFGQGNAGRTLVLTSSLAVAVYICLYIWLGTYSGLISSVTHG